MARRKANEPIRRSAFESMLQIDAKNCEVQVCLASVTEREPTPDFHRLKVSDDVAQRFCEIVSQTFRKRQKAANSGDFAMRPYEAGSKIDPHEVEYLDLKVHETVASQIMSLTAMPSVAHFDGNDDIIARLRFYVITVTPINGEPIHCFRSTSSKMELGRSRWFGIFLASGQYDQFQDKMFLFDEHIDCVSKGNDLYIFNKGQFQKIIRFFEMIRKAAQQTLTRIRETVPIDNFEAFEAACEGHLLMLSKLKNIAEKPYLDRLTAKDMKKVIKKFDLPIEMTGPKGKEKLVYDPSDKWAILRLLDDDYLKSLMTGESYEVNSKRRL